MGEGRDEGEGGRGEKRQCKGAKVEKWKSVSHNNGRVGTACRPYHRSGPPLALIPVPGPPSQFSTFAPLHRPSADLHFYTVSLLPPFPSSPFSVFNVCTVALFRAMPYLLSPYPYPPSPYAFFARPAFCLTRRFGR